MAKITKAKVVESNILGEFIQQAERSLSLLAANTQGAQAMHTATLKVAKAFDGTAKSQRELIKNDILSEKLVQQKIKNDEQEQKMQYQIQKSKKLQLQIDRDINKEKEKQAKAAEKEAKAIKDSSSEYSRQSKRLNELRKSYKDLMLVQGKETAQTQALRKEITQLDGALKKVDARVGQHQRSVGNYEKALGGVRNMLGQLGLAFGVFSVLKDVFNITKNNEEAMASLSAITGLTGEKFEQFENKVNDVAKNLRVSSTDVAKAFELIASAQPALLKDADALAAVTEQAIILNKAIKGDLSETSLALVGVMNQFGLEASEASRIINVLAAGSQAGAATVNQINESMVKFGTTAKLLNVSVEESVGLIETLGEKAIFGAEAGTALKNVMLIMSSIDVLPPKALKQLEKYGVDTSIVKDQTISFSERLKELSKIGGDTTAIMQIFGKENATAATVLLNSTETLDKMTAAVTGTSVAQEQAAVNSNTLANVLLEVRAAWENMVVEFMNGNDALEGLKAVLRFVADNMVAIIKTVLHAISVWASYRLALKLWNSEGTGMIQVLKNIVTPIQKTNDAVKDLAANTNKVKIGFAGWVGIIVALLPYLIQAGKEIYDMFMNTSALEKATEKYNVEIGKEKDKMQLLYDKLKMTNAGSKERKVLIDQINATYGTSLTNIHDETSFLNQLAIAYREVTKEMEKKLMQRILEEDYLDALRRKREADKAVSELTKADFLLDVSGTTSILRAQSKAIEDLEEIRAEMARLNFSLTGATEGFGNLHKGTAKVGDEMDDTTNSIDKTTDALKKLHEEMANQNKIGGAGKIERIDGGLSAPKEEGFNIYSEIVKLGAEANRERIEQQRKLYEDLIDEQEKGLKILESDLLASGMSTAAIERTLKEQRIENLREQVEKSAELFGESSDQYIDANLALNRALAEQQAKAIESLRDSIVDASKLIEDFANRAIEAIDRQIEAIESQVDASKTREDQLREQAEKGELDADEAITVERDRQKALIAEKQALERKKMEIEATLIMLRAFAAAVEQGQGNPVANIKSQVTDILAFAKNLPGFIDGTETTVSKSLGSPNLNNVGPDNYAIRVNGDERILNPSLSKQIPDYVTNADLVRSYLFNKSGQQIHDNYMDGNSIASKGGSVDQAMFDKMDEFIAVTKELPSKMPKHQNAFDSLIGAFTWRDKEARKSITVIAPIRKRF